MEKYAMWEQFEGGKILIPEDEIEEKVFLDDQDIKLELTSKELTSKGLNEDKLTEELSKFCEKHQIENQRIGFDELEDFLESKGFDEATSATYSNDFVEQVDAIVFNQFHNEFDNLKNYDTMRVYEHLDSNSNWKTLYSHDSETIIEIDDEKGQSLDIWDGNNFQTGGFPNHQKFYPITKIDGEPVEEETYLLKEWDQYQGTFETGEILDKEELMDHIKELGDRDLKDYGLEDSKEEEKCFVGGYYDDRNFPDYDGKTPFNKDVNTYSLKQIENNELGFIQDVEELYAEENDNEWSNLSYNDKVEFIINYVSTDEIAGLDHFKTEKETEEYKQEILKEIQEIESETEYVGKEQDRTGNYPNHFNDVYRKKNDEKKEGKAEPDSDVRKEQKTKMAYMRNQIER